MIGLEYAAMVEGSSFGYVADDTITPAEPAAIPATNGFRYGSSAVVVLSTTRTATSVFDRTRPRPGKCLMMVSTRASCEVVTTVVMAPATLSGFEPYCRWKPPIGGLPSPRPAGTVS